MCETVLFFIEYFYTKQKENSIKESLYKLLYYGQAIPQFG